MSFEIDGQTGVALTETQQGCTQPADYSFACVNDFVHRVDRQYEELEALCLGMANHFDKLNDNPESKPIGYTSKSQIEWSKKDHKDPVWWFEKCLPNQLANQEPFEQIPLYTSPYKPLSDNKIKQLIAQAKETEEFFVSQIEIDICKAALKAASND